MDKPKKVTKAKKTKVAAEGKKAAEHPKYEVMIVEVSEGVVGAYYDRLTHLFFFRLLKH